MNIESYGLSAQPSGAGQKASGIKQVTFWWLDDPLCQLSLEFLSHHIPDGSHNQQMVWIVIYCLSTWWNNIFYLQRLSYWLQVHWANISWYLIHIKGPSVSDLGSSIYNMAEMEYNMLSLDTRTERWRRLHRPRIAYLSISEHECHCKLCWSCQSVGQICGLLSDDLETNARCLHALSIPVKVTAATQVTSVHT